MLCCPLDDLAVGSALATQRFLSLPRDLQKLGCCYSIAWQKHDGVIIPTSMRGESEFLRESKYYTFLPNQGYVGSTFAQGTVDSEVISDMLSVDPRAFLRKSAALLNGVSSVLLVFQNHRDDVLLEFGFTCPTDAGSALPLLRTSHAHVLRQCVVQRSLCFERQASQSDDEGIITRKGETVICRTRSPSPEHTDDENKDNEVVICRTRSPSPERALSWCPSIGSRGHPFCCQLACKYIRKRGCKDGPLCTRCHLCHYTRASEKKSRNQKGLLESVMSAPSSRQAP